MNYRQLIERYTRGIPTLRARYGSAFAQVLHGILPDSLAEGMTHALKAPWMLDEQTEDAIALLASERQMPRYKNDVSADGAVALTGARSHQYRLQHAWGSYQFGGSKQDIVAHLAAAGYPNSYLRTFSDANWADVLPSAPDYWWTDPGPFSEFVVVIRTPNPVTGLAKTWGSFDWGDGTLWGCQGDFAGINEVRSIVAKRKPVQYRCTLMTFEVGVNTWVDIPF